MIQRSQVQVPALGMAGELSSPGPTFCADPCVTAVALKRSWSCCPKYRLTGYSQTHMHPTYVASEKMML